MSEKRSTTNLDEDMMDEIDAIARVLAPLYGGKPPKRVVVVRRAVHDLFLRVCPLESTIGYSEGQPPDFERLSHPE